MSSEKNKSIISIQIKIVTYFCWKQSLTFLSAHKNINVAINNPGVPFLCLLDSQSYYCPEVLASDQDEKAFKEIIVLSNNPLKQGKQKEKMKRKNDSEFFLLHSIATIE